MKYILIMLAGVFISSVSQVLLKKAADRTWPSRLREYLNLPVIAAYALFGASVVINILAYRGLDLGLGAVLEATGYIWVTLFGVFLFHEKMNRRKLLALGLILAGTVLASLS